MFLLELAATLGDAVAGIYRGQLEPTAVMATHVGNLLAFCTSFLLGATFTTFLIDSVAPQSKAARRWELCVWLLSIAGCIGAFFGLFYIIDPVTNIYHRLPTFWISDLIGAIVDFGALVVLVVNWNNVHKSSRFVMFTYILLPLPLLVIHALYYGLNLAIIATSSAMFLFFVEMQSQNAQLMTTQQLDIARQQVLLAEKERSLTETRISSMVSQIQPHFLYNTLDSIYCLCTDDPEAAAEAVSLFSDYLRGNLGSLRQSTPIPIELELEHVRNYLQLEAMSSFDTIRFEIDQQARGFSVPALSVQPLTENAVKHGISKRPEGGTVTVRTLEEPDRFLVVVQDDGVGCDEDTPEAEGHTHIGIENIRERLESMCGASLEIESTPGTGTVATIIVPKDATARTYNAAAADQGAL